jgi:hypothetical protein
MRQLSGFVTAFWGGFGVFSLQYGSDKKPAVLFVGIRRP